MNDRLVLVTIKGKRLHKFKSGITRLVLLCALITSSGCAYQYIDANGNHRILGIANVVIPPGDQTSCEEKSVSVTALGLSLINLPSHGGFAIGYSKNSSITMPISKEGCMLTKEAEDSK